MQSEVMSKSAAAIEQAAAAVHAAKQQERSAATARVLAEEQLIALLGQAAPLPSEGTYSEEVGAYRVAVTAKLNRTVDADALARIAPQIPEQIGRRLIRWKPDVDLRELRYLQASEPALYGVVSTAITTKPAKASVSVERREG